MRGAPAEPQIHAFCSLSALHDLCRVLSSPDPRGHLSEEHAAQLPPSLRLTSPRSLGCPTQGVSIPCGRKILEQKAPFGAVAPGKTIREFSWLEMVRSTNQELMVPGVCRKDSKLWINTGFAAYLAHSRPAMRIRGRGAWEALWSIN